MNIRDVGNPSLNRIVANPNVVPEWATAMTAEWAAAIRALPPGVGLANATSLEPTRVAAIITGSATPTRSEIARLDWALATDAARFLPALSSTTIPQRSNRRVRIKFVDASAVSRYLPDAPRRRVRMPKVAGAKGTSGNHGRSAAAKARAARWTEALAASGISMPEIAQKTRVDYRRVKSILRAGSVPTASEMRALERVLGPA